VPRLPGAAAACFAIAGRDGEAEKEKLTQLARMASRNHGNGRAACAVLPLAARAGPPEAGGAQEKLWLFPEASGPGGGFRYAALLQRDATSRGLLKLL